MRTGSLLCWALLAALAAEGAELCVAKSGNDKNPGSAKAPFATIGRAAAAAKPGDTVKIGPGIYREQITFKRSGRKGAPVVFAGTRGKNGEFLTIVEAPGKVLAGWTPAPEIHREVWKTPLAKRPDLIMMDGAMITFVNSSTMKLAPWKKLPAEMDENMFWGAFGPGCRRLPGFDLMRLPAGIKVKHQYFGKRKELFWPTIGNVLSGWSDGFLYVRFADGGKPRDHRFTASYGSGFDVAGSYLTFRDLHMRGSRNQFRIRKGSAGVTIDGCLLMHGGARIRIEEGSSGVTVKNSILTAGFVRSDLFKLRSAEDMRGGLLYVIFKYIIGTSSSDDSGLKVYGNNCRIVDNLILQGLIGMDAYGPGCEVAGNVVREMSSVGICTGPRTVGEFHDKLVMNCGIPLRIHRLRDQRAKREEYHYRNLFVQDRHGGSQIFVHCESHRWGPDVVNFEKVPGKKEPVYKKNPPAPVDAGKIHIYHNTFWGGDDWRPAFSVQYLYERFRMAMPFYLVNNIFKDCPSRLLTMTHELAGPNLLYLFSERMEKASRRDPEVPKLNRTLDVKTSAKIWNKNDLPGLPDLSLAPDSPALGAGVDISKPFTVRGKSYPALPGFAPGYFKGKTPAAGALQQGESAQRFVDMHKKAEAAIRMLSELKKNAANESRPEIGK